MIAGTSASALQLIHIFSRILVSCMYTDYLSHPKLSIKYCYYIASKDVMMEKWPVLPYHWESSYDPTLHRDYLCSKKIEGIQPDNHCKQTYQMIKPLITRNRGLVDIGCRDGEFSHYAQFDFQRIYGFEYRWDYPWQKNFAKNMSSQNVTLFWQGLSDVAETIESGGTGIVNLKGGASTKTTDLLPLDAFNLQNIDLIKVDTDGFEYKIIQGALETIRRSWPMLVIEQGYFDNKETLKFCVEELGYKHVATCSRDLDHVLIKE